MIETTVVKPRVKALDEGTLSEAEIQGQIKAGVVELERYLAVAESLMASDGFVFGEQLTWADFFLFPLLADLRAVPEWRLVSDRLKRWAAQMDTLDAVKATAEGTLSVGASADVVLFEPLMRAAVHGDADALGRIDRLVGELRTVEALHLLPDGLEELVTVVREAVTTS